MHDIMLVFLHAYLTSTELIHCLGSTQYLKKVHHKIIYDLY